MSTLQDLTFSGVLRESSALVWSVDRDLRLTSCVGPAVQALGSDAERAVGMTLLDFFQLQDQASPLVAAHLHALRGESITFAFEWGGRGYEAFVSPQRDAQGQIFGCPAMAREPIRLDQETAPLYRLFNLSRQMLCTATTDGYFQQLDPTLAASLGYSVEELRARPFVEFVHPADREATRRELAKLIEGKPVLRFENRYRSKDGSYRWLAWTSVLQEDKGVLYATALDITERRRAEELFRAALESAPDAVIIVDLSGEIILINRVTETLFGYSRTELQGQPVELLVPACFRSQHVKNRQHYCAQPSIRPMGGGGCFCARRKDGSEFPIEVSLSPVELDEGRMVFAAIRDISERTRMENEIRARQVQLLAAQRIQEHFLPKAPPRLPGFDIAGALYAADYAAGDFFDFIPVSEGRIGIVVGDVCGKGFSSALVSASTHELLRAAASVRSTAEDMVTHANVALAGEMDDGMFVTLLLALLDSRSHNVEFVNAGHPDGYVLDRHGAIKHHLSSSAGILGLSGETRFAQGPSVQLDPGDLLLVFTDGVLEARSSLSAAGEFGVERTLDVARRNLDQPAKDIAAAIYRAVSDFSENHLVRDDVTIVAIKCLGDAEPVAGE